MTATNDRPLMKNAVEMSNTPMVRPATAGPTIRAALKIAEFRATALPMSSRPTISMTNDWRVGMSMAWVQPRAKARMTISQTWTVPVAVRMPRMKARLIETDWVAMSVRRLGRLSATIPPNRPKIITGTNCAAATTPSMNGSFVRVRTSQAWATACIQVPTSEMSWPDQNSRKLRWRRARKPSRPANARAWLIASSGGEPPAARAGGRHARPRREPCAAGLVPGQLGFDLGQVLGQVGLPAVRLGDHRLEPVGLAPKRGDLAVDPGEGVLDDRPALAGIVRLAEPGTVAGASGLVLEQLGDLGQAEAGVVAETLDVAESVEVVGVVQSVVAVGTGGRLEQPDLLVVADRAGRQTELRGDLLDPEEPGRCGVGHSESTRPAARGLGGVHGTILAQPSR